MILNITWQSAAIGDVLQIEGPDTIPEDWHLLDGSRQSSRDWPLFVKTMGIKGAYFVLPEPQRSLPGTRWVIRLGARCG